MSVFRGVGVFLLIVCLKSESYQNADVSGLGDESIFTLRDYLKSRSFQNAEMQKQVYLGMGVYFPWKYI